MSTYKNPESIKRHRLVKVKNKRTVTEWKEHYGKKETIERRFIKKQLINSSGCICAICNKPITNMKDCTLDHIIPVSKGGLTTIENCRLAHLKCNQERGNDQEFDQHCSQC